MKVMVMVKATESSEAGKMPDEELLAEMGKFNEDLVRAGIGRRFSHRVADPQRVRPLFQTRSESRDVAMSAAAHDQPRSSVISSGEA